MSGQSARWWLSRPCRCSSTCSCKSLVACARGNTRHGRGCWRQLRGSHDHGCGALDPQSPRGLRRFRSRGVCCGFALCLFSCRGITGSWELSTGASPIAIRVATSTSTSRICHDRGAGRFKTQGAKCGADHHHHHHHPTTTHPPTHLPTLRSDGSIGRFIYVSPSVSGYKHTSSYLIYILCTQNGYENLHI